MQVGVIGVGHMAKAMARNLLKSGHKCMFSIRRKNR